MPDSIYSALLLLRDVNFFPSLDPNQSNLSLTSDQSPDECPLTEVIDDCLSSLFEKSAWHSPGDCDVNSPQVAVNASDGHLNTCLIEVPLQGTLQNQTVRVTDYCTGSILTHTYTQLFVIVAIIRLYIVSMYGVPSLWIWRCFFLHSKTIEYKFPHTVQETAANVHKFEQTLTRFYTIKASSTTSTHYHLSSLPVYIPSQLSFCIT